MQCWWLQPNLSLRTWQTLWHTQLPSTPKALPSAGQLCWTPEKNQTKSKPVRYYDRGVSDKLCTKNTADNLKSLELNLLACDSLHPAKLSCQLASSNSWYAVKHSFICSMHSQQMHTDPLSPQEAVLGIVPKPALASCMTRCISNTVSWCLHTYSASLGEKHMRVGQVTITLPHSAVPMFQAINLPFMHPCRYAITLSVPKGSVRKGIYFDTANPHHAVRLIEGGDGRKDLLLISGEEHDQGIKPEEYADYFGR